MTPPTTLQALPSSSAAAAAAAPPQHAARGGATCHDLALPGDEGASHSGDGVEQQAASSSSSDGSNHSATPASAPPASSRGTSAGPVAGALWSAVQPLLARWLGPAALVIGASTWLLQRGRKQGAAGPSPQAKQQKPADQAPAAAAVPEPPEPASTLPVFASDFRLHTSEVALVSRPAALEGLTCVVAEHIPIQGATIGCGMPLLWDSLPTAPAHAAFTQRFLIKGFSIVGQAATQPCNYPTLGTNLRNPVARYRVAGGGASGALAAVALGEAHAALCTDWLGSTRIPAAAQSQYALVCTAGALGQGSMGEAAQPDPAYAGVAGAAAAASCSSRCGSSGSIEAAAIAAGDLAVIRRAAEYMALPGTSDLRGDLTQVVVAEDLFALCEPEMEEALLSMKRAVIHWAGQEQAGSVQLIPFLESNCTAWQRLLPAADASPLAAVRTGAGQPLPPVLRALTYAAQLLLHAELHERYGALAAAAAAEAEPGQEGSGLVGVHQWQQDPLVAAALAAGAAAQPEELEAAQETAAEVQDLLSKAVKHDVVVVVPCVPAAPPRLDAPQQEAQSWLARAHAFAALTSLGACPCVVLPVAPASTAARDAGSASGPLSLALFGHSRSDQRLLTVAERLAIGAQAEFRKLQEKKSELAAATAAAEPAAPTPAGSSKQPGRGQGPKRQPQSAEVDAKRLAKADKAKQRGNEAFKLGKYRDAIKTYSEAVKLDPGNPVYLSNRALAHLKLFSFEAAELDCSAALAVAHLAAADRVKALLRRGTARIHKNELDAAAADFRQVLAVEPNNRQAREELRALQQQEREMQAERVQAMAAMQANGGGPPGGVASSSTTTGNGRLGLLPPGLLESLAVPAAAAQLAAGGDAGWQQLEAMVQSGAPLPVVLAEEGRAVSGPRGEPVLVLPGAQEVMVEPSGGVRPHRARRKPSSS